MQNYFTLYTLFIKGDTKFWLVVLDKYKKLQTRHKRLTLILKYKSALLCCFSLRCKYQIPKRFYIFLFKENLSNYQSTIPPLFVWSSDQFTLPSLRARPVSLCSHLRKTLLELFCCNPQRVLIWFRMTGPLGTFCLTL